MLYVRMYVRMYIHMYMYAYLPQVLDEDLSREDHRTMHEALPPTGGLKFSSNLWLHQHDFRTPNMHGCDMGGRVDRTRHNWPVDDVSLALRTNRTTGWPTKPPRGAPHSQPLDEHGENDEL